MNKTQIENKINILKLRQNELNNKLIPQQELILKQLTQSKTGLELEKTVKGQEVRQVIKQLNKTKTDITSGKYQLSRLEMELYDIPSKIKRYEKLKNKTSENIYEYMIRRSKEAAINA